MSATISPSNSSLLIGASWYPEMWPESEWPKDLSKMQEIGFNAVRLFEFAWKKFEPREGEFDFDWAIDLLDRCQEAGIRVMLGTPTAAPPAWLTTNYPEVLETKADGTVATHGKRKHYNHHSATYRRFCRKIVGEMARRLGGHPAVFSWQIDNEMSGFDYGEETRKAFHCWLEKRYGTVENLNETWGLNFWSQAYDRFDQVPLCTSEVGSVEVPERHHPSLIIAIARFQNDGWESFIQAQCEEIRKHSQAPITTNMTGYFGGMNWYQQNEGLDVAGYSMYADVDHYHYNLPRFDRMRRQKDRPFWLLETAPNWSGGGRQWNIHHDADGVRAFSWLSYLLGGELILYWQWRSHWAGQEMLHGTHVTSAGNWAPNKDAWAQIAREGRELGPWLQENPPPKAEVGLLTSFEAGWGFSIDPVDTGMQYSHRIRDDFHAAFLEHQFWRDIICSESAPLDSYKILFAPMLPTLSAKRVAELRAWVEKGGVLVTGPLTGYRTEEFTAHQEQELGPLTELLGTDAELGFTVQWVEDRCRIVFSGEESYPSRNWCVAFAEKEGVEVLARYEGGYGDGRAAMIAHSIGQGKVIALGGMLMEGGYATLARRLCEEAGVFPMGQANLRVMLIPRANAGGRVTGYGIVNLREEPSEVELDFAGTDAFSGEPWPGKKTLAPLQVLLLRAENSE
ncbi:MAG: beta-galactosidase [Opitutales bacterium]|nr:beta-galactosidase [Opitutales bacterium]MCH8541589.1 beta-galactosidase [Opitutales bacterium]